MAGRARQNWQSGLDVLGGGGPRGDVVQYQSVRCMNRWGGWGPGRLGCLSCIDEQTGVHIRWV